MHIGGNRCLPTQEPQGRQSPKHFLKGADILRAPPPPPPPRLWQFFDQRGPRSLVNYKCVIWERSARCSRGALAPGGGVAKREKGVCWKGMQGRWSQITVFILPSACSAPSLVLTVHSQAASKRRCRHRGAVCVLNFTVWAAVVSCLQRESPQKCCPLGAETQPPHFHPPTPHAREGGVARAELSGSSS